MPKERAPISTRLRNRDKIGKIATPAKDVSTGNVKRKEAIPTLKHLKEENITFSPRKDPNIYMDELQSPLSYIRGTDEERNHFLKEEDDVMKQSFGSDYRSTLKLSTFYSAKVSAPVPSKRTRHRTPQPTTTSSSTKLSFDRVLKNSNLRGLSTSTLPNSKRQKLSSSISPSASPSLSPTLPSTASLTTTLSDIVNPSATRTNVSSSITNKSKSSKQLKTSRSKKQRPKTSTTTINNTVSGFDDIESSGGATIATPLPLSKKLPVYIKINAKDKEKEYWRRQRRVFIHSRFITNEEGVMVAKTVYSNLSVTPSNRMVISFQGNIANFRTKLRRIFDTHAQEFNITKDYIESTDDATLIREVKAKMNLDTLKSIWDHWITDPFVDTKMFYDANNKSSVNMLVDITVQLMIIHFKEQFTVLSPKQARTEMKKLDSLSRNIILPDASELR